MRTRPHPDEDEEDIGLLVATGLLLMILVITVVEFCENHWRTIVALVLISLTLVCEALLFRWNAARYTVVGCSFAVIALSYIIANLSLENQSRRARSTMELWRDRGGYRRHRTLASWTAGAIVVFAAVVEYQPSTSVFWPGVVITLLLVPSVVLAIGFLSNGSYLVQE